MNFSASLSVTSALSVVPFQEKLKTLSRSSTLSANHSCNPAGVLKNSYKIEGEHLTGYSSINCCFFVIYCQLISYEVASGAMIEKKFRYQNFFSRQNHYGKWVVFNGILT